MQFGLDDETLEKICGVFARCPEVEEVILYGSRAKGCFREGSDIDLTVKGKDVHQNTVTQLWLDLDDLDMPYLIDLPVFCELKSPSLLEHITRGGKVFYQRAAAENPAKQ